MDASLAGREERLIGALVPTAISRLRPSPPPMPVVPRHVATEPAAPVVGTARLDRSGRLSVRPLLRRLGWRPGDRITINVLDGAVMIVPGAAGRHTVGGRGDLALPAAARQLCGIGAHQLVMVVAYPAWDLLVVHPVDRVAHLLAEFHARLVGGRDGG